MLTEGFLEQMAVVADIVRDNPFGLAAAFAIVAAVIFLAAFKNAPLAVRTFMALVAIAAPLVLLLVVLQGNTLEIRLTDAKWVGNSYGQLEVMTAHEPAVRAEACRSSCLDKPWCAAWFTDGSKNCWFYDRPTPVIGVLPKGHPTGSTGAFGGLRLGFTPKSIPAKQSDE